VDNSTGKLQGNTAGFGRRVSQPPLTQNKAASPWIMGGFALIPYDAGLEQRVWVFRPEWEEEIRLVSPRTSERLRACGGPGRAPSVAVRNRQLAKRPPVINQNPLPEKAALFFLRQRNYVLALLKLRSARSVKSHRTKSSNTDIAHNAETRQKLEAECTKKPRARFFLPAMRDVRRM
jgi:hypothetical protein